MHEKLRSQRETVISLPKSWDTRRNREAGQVCVCDWAVVLLSMTSIAATLSKANFLLICSLFQNTRLTYLSNLHCPLTSEFLLHGDDRLSDDINISIFLSVQKYIRATKRFGTG